MIPSFIIFDPEKRMGAAGPLSAFQFISQILLDLGLLRRTMNTTTLNEFQEPLLCHRALATTIVETNGIAKTNIPTKSAVKNDSDEELDGSSLTSTDTSDTSFSSVDDDDYSSWCSDAEEVTGYRRQPRRQVTFHPHVEVREYSLTISEHPFCDDPYPVSLDWAYAGPYTRHIDDSKTRGMTYNPGRRICVEAKRRRLAEVRGCSETDIDEMIRSPYEIFPFGWLILTYFSKLLAAVTFPTLERSELVEDDEYRLLYTGTATKGSLEARRPTGMHMLTSRERDLEAGLY